MSSKNETNSKSSYQPVTCELCKTKLMSAQEQIEHAFSLMHHIKLDQLKDGKWTHRCSLCNIELGSLKSFISHMHGKKHKKILIAQQEKWERHPPTAKPIPNIWSICQDKNEITVIANGTSKQTNSEHISGSEKTTKTNSTKDIETPSHSKISSSISRRSSSSDKHVKDTRGTRRDNARDKSRDRNTVSNHKNAPFSTNRTYDQFKKDATFRFNFANEPNSSRYDRSRFGNYQEQRNYGTPQHNNSQQQYIQQNGGYYPNFYPNDNPNWNYQNQYNNGGAMQMPYWPNGNNYVANPSTWNNYTDFNLGNEQRPNSNKVTASNQSSTTHQNANSDNTNSSYVPKQNENAKEKLGVEKAASSKESIVKNEPSDKTLKAPLKKTHKDKTKKSTEKSKEKSTEKSSEKSTGRTSKKVGKSHLIFLSSDSNITSEEEDIPLSCRKIKKPFKKKVSVSSSVNEKVLKAKKDYNKSIISRLVNNPCTRKQQMQLTRWMREHTKSRQKLLLPRFNLPLGENNSESTEGEMRTIVSDVISEFPEDVIASLFEALSNDQASNNEPKSTSMATEYNSVTELTESGNIPWAVFLKSLSESDPVGFPAEELARVDNVSTTCENITTTTPATTEDLVTSTNNISTNEVDRPKSVIDNLTNNGDRNLTTNLNESPIEVTFNNTKTPAIPIRIKKEPVEQTTPIVIELDESSNDCSNKNNSPTSSICPTTAQLEEILLPYYVKKEAEENSSDRASPEVSINVPIETPVKFSKYFETATTSPLNFSPQPSVSGISGPSLIEHAIEKTQLEFANWLGQINAQEVADKEEATVPPTTTNSFPQDVVNQLLVLSKEEDQLRDQTQKVEQMITQLYRLLEEWKTKRNEIMHEELRLRAKRLKLLESLQGGLTSKNENCEAVSQPNKSQPETSDENSQNKVTYLGTLDQTWELIQQIGASIGMPIGEQPATPQQNSRPISQQSNEEESNSETKKSTKKSKRKSTESEKLLVKKKKTDKSGSATLKKKTKKKISKKVTDSEPIDQAALSANVLQKLISSLPISDNMRNQLSSAATAKVNENTLHTKLPRFLDTENENDFLTSTFGPITIHKSAVIDIKIFKGFMYTCSSDTTAKCLDISDPSKIVLFEEHKKTVSAIQVTTSENGIDYVFTASHDGYLRCYDSQSGECVNKINAQDPIICMAKGWGKLFIGMHNGLVLPYSIASAEFLEPILCSQGAVSRIVTCSEGSHRLLCIAAYDGSVTLRNATTGLLVRCLEGKVRPPCCIQVDSSQIYITTAEKTILIHNLLTGELIKTIKCPSSATGLFVHGDFVLACSFDGFIRCYKKKDWTLHAIYYSAGKTMTMCMEVLNDWVYTGNRHGIVEAFKTNHKTVIPCRFQNCSYPFGRQVDLEHHLKEDHLEEANHFTKCPWRGCEKEFLGYSDLKTYQHILSHCSTIEGSH